MKIITCYTAQIKSQLLIKKDNKTGEAHVEKEQPVNGRLMKQTSSVCLSALKTCAGIFLKEWDYLSSLPSSEKSGVLSRKNAAEMLIHSTKGNTAKYPEFDESYPYMPSYTRRAVAAGALGMVSSYKSNHKNWEALKPEERGEEPTLGFPDRYELTFYDQERNLCDLDKGIIGLKLYDGKVWDWHYFKISPSDAKYVSKTRKTRKILSPIVEKVGGKYRIRFSFEERKDLVQNENPLVYTILSVDLGINAAASWSVMTCDGSVHAKGVIRLNSDEDRLNRLINRKRMLVSSGKKPKAIYRMITGANRQLAVDTCKAVMDIAVRYSVDCIVFEHLDKKGKTYRERIHMWRADDVQSRVELQAHRYGMRISRVCAWGTSKLAFDGSGPVVRGSAAGLNTYSLCRFQNGKVYNCDISAAQNIGARFFLRLYRKEYKDLPKTPQCTLATLTGLVKTIKSQAS